MDFKEKKENLAHLSPKELSDILVLLGDWLPVARQVVSIKAAFSKKPIDREYLEKNLKENLTIDEYVEWKQCGPYSLIVGEVHDQLKKLVDEGDSKTLFIRPLASNCFFLFLPPLAIISSAMAKACSSKMAG